MGNAASAVPYGAQISQLYANLAMLVSYDEFIYQFPIKLSLTSPLVGGAGQQIYFSDGAGYLQLPDFYKGLYGSTQYNATLSLYLNVSGASPYDFPVVTSVSKQWMDANSTLLDFALPGTTLNPIGPFTLGSAGQNADLSISGFWMNLQLQNASGALLGRSDDIPRPEYAVYVPTVPGYTYVISSTVVDTSSGTPLQPSNGIPGQFPAINLNEKTTFVHPAINCSQINNLGHPLDTTFNLTMGGTGPAVVKQNQTFLFTDYNSYFTLPAYFIGDLTSIFGSHGERTEVLTVTLGYLDDNQEANLTGLGLRLSGAGPASIDIARQFNSSTFAETIPLSAAYYIPTRDYKDEAIALPRTGSLALGPFTADPDGTQVNANFAILHALVRVDDPEKGLSGLGRVVCQARSPPAFLRSANC